MNRKELGMDKDRKQIFIELVAQGKEPYRACIEAGYSESYAHSNSHILRDKYVKEIEELKPAMKEAIKEEFKYTVIESFKKLNEIQELALREDEKGNYTNLNAAIKAEELKGRMYGVYEADNSQKTPDLLEIKVVRKEEG
jgi:hypothetical protein